MSLTSQQKAVIFFFSLPIGLATSVAGYLTPIALSKLSEAVPNLPEVTSATRSIVLKEIKGQLSTNVTSMAADNPFDLARRVEYLWLCPSDLKLTVGLKLLETVQSRNAKYSYLHSLKSKAVWWHVDGPHLDEELAEWQYQFKEDGVLLEDGTLEEDQYFVLDPSGKFEYAGVRYRKCSEKEVNAKDSWMGIGLNPGAILAWHARFLSKSNGQTFRKPNAADVAAFSELVKERAIKGSFNTEWLVGSESKERWVDPSLSLVLEASTPGVGPLRAAILLRALYLSDEERQKFFEQLTSKERDEVCGQLEQLKNRQSESEQLMSHLRSLGIHTIANRPKLLTDVVRGSGVVCPRAWWQANLLACVSSFQRAEVRRHCVAILSESEEVRLLSIYALLQTSSSEYKRTAKLVASQFVLNLLRPTPTTEIECQQLILKNPLKAALAFRRGLNSSWGDTRLDVWARKDARKAAQAIAKANPTNFLSLTTLSAALFSRLTPEVSSLLKAYLMALGQEVNKHESPDSETTGKALAMFHTLLQEQIQGDSQYNVG